MRLTQRKIKANVTNNATRLVWDPRERTLSLKNLLTRKEHWSVTVDETFDATFVEHGTIHSTPSAGAALAGAALIAPLPGSAVVGAVIGSSIHNVTDTRSTYIEITGDGFHEIVEARYKEDLAKVARIAVGIKQAAIEARK